jgi:hypothetical protein
MSDEEVIVEDNSRQMIISPKANSVGEMSFENRP